MCLCVYKSYLLSFILSLSLSIFYPLCLVISLVLYLLIDISFRKWCSSGMLDFNSFQWNERTVICDADASNPFSMLRSVPNFFSFSSLPFSFECMSDDESYMRLYGMCVCVCSCSCVNTVVANVCCEHIYLSIDVYVNNTRALRCAIWASVSVNGRANKQNQIKTTFISCTVKTTKKKNLTTMA